MRSRLRWTGLLGAVLLAGCGKQIPEEIIQPAQMEAILYDYHLSTAMGVNMTYSENYKKEALRQYAFRKHGVTEAEFDSSMVWYTRHTSELALIYTNLGTRFREEKKAMAKLLAARENIPEVSLPGDTVDVWYNDRLYWLTDSPLANKVSFTLPADSNFKARDAFRWEVDYVFLGGKGRKLTMALNVLFDNDSVAGRVAEITSSGVHSLYVAPDSAYAVRSVNGFIYLSPDSASLPGVLANHITLTRYHARQDSTARAALPAAGGETEASGENGGEKNTAPAPSGRNPEQGERGGAAAPEGSPERKKAVRPAPREMKKNPAKADNAVPVQERVRLLKTN